MQRMIADKARAPFQVVVIPFRRRGAGLHFAALQRADDGRWQGIAGGGERGESPLAAARRETREEVGIGSDAHFVKLDSVASIPVHHFRDRRLWPSGMFVIPEYAFGVDCSSMRLRLSNEHVAAQWGSYAAIMRRLSWQSNQTALWELRERLRGAR